MARRSDHSRADLRRMILAEGHRHLEDVGFARFSAREVARRIGYSVGTIYNVFGTLDQLLFEINTMTFEKWSDHIESKLAVTESRRLEALVDGYFEFAQANRNLWRAIWSHMMPADEPIPEAAAAARSRLTGLVATEVTAMLPASRHVDAERLARSLIATVHGHCDYAMSGAFALMGEPDANGLAKERVSRELGLVDKAQPDEP